jgi:hypothetical protein
LAEQVDELVTIEGTVIAGLSPVVTAALIVGDSELPIERRDTFTLLAKDGRRIEIEPAKNPVMRPLRKVSGPWREISEHPVRPTGDFYPDGHVKLRGEWLVPGESIVVIGYVKAHDFVPDTGGHRDAPERQISLVRAIAIGVGDDAADDAKQAMKDRERDIAKRAKPKSPPKSTGYAWLAIVALVWAALLVFVDRSGEAETLGLALTSLIFALLLSWRALPTEKFPGGAVDDEEVADPNTMLWFNAVVYLPVVLILFWLGGGEEPGKRNGITNAGWILLGALPLWKVSIGLLAKPRAVNGSQIELPANRAWRWIIVFGLFATWIASLVMGIPFMSADGT